MALTNQKALTLEQPGDFTFDKTLIMNTKQSKLNLGVD